MQTGRRAWQCELSTVDSAFLLAGMLTAAGYFDADTADENEIRTLADALYRQALSLPSSVGLDAREQERVIDAVIHTAKRVK